MLFPTFLKTYKTHKGYRTHELTTYATFPVAASQYTLGSISDSTVSSVNGDDGDSDDVSAASGVVVTGCQYTCFAFGSGISNIDSIMV